jgi:hypothetical protein
MAIMNIVRLVTNMTMEAKAAKSLANSNICSS